MGGAVSAVGPHGWVGSRIIEVLHFRPLVSNAIELHTEHRASGICCLLSEVEIQTLQPTAS